MEIDTLPRPAASAKFRWGDIEDDGPDENGVKKVIEFKFNNGDGNKVEITSRRAAERRAWAKFGDAAVHEDVGARLTMASTEEIILQRPRASPGSKAEETKIAGNLLAQHGKGGAFLMVCRTCGKKGDHWTSKCLYKDLAPQPEGFVDKPAASGSTKGAYVPPGMRAGAETTGQEMQRRNEENSVRVTNLSEDTRDADLLELFCTFGAVSRVHVAIDQKTGLSRGFGFVNFVNKADAERAINKLNGFGYDNLILRVEWATPRAN